METCAALFVLRSSYNPVLASLLSREKLNLQLVQMGFRGREGGRERAFCSEAWEGELASSGTWRICCINICMRMCMCVCPCMSLASSLLGRVAWCVGCVSVHSEMHVLKCVHATA